MNQPTVWLQQVDALLPEGTACVHMVFAGAKIAYIGEALPPAALQHGALVVDGRGFLAAPGFVNTHTHAAMTLFRSYADDMLLMDWLQHKIWPAEDRLTGEDVYWATLAAIGEMIKSGTTTYADMYFFMNDVARATDESGMRGVLARGMAGVAPTAEQALTESRAFYREWHNQAEGRITVMLGPHAPYTCPSDYLKRVVSLSEELGAEIHIHLSETKGEVEDCFKLHGKSPIQHMADLGVLQRGVLAAHCVHVDEHDLALMKAHNVRVAHNPQSNLKLASGFAPVPAMLAAGITVGLGTDGTASNNNLDLLEEVRLAAMLHKAVTGNPQVVPARQALDLATRDGAAALGLGSQVGELRVGAKADVVLYERQGLHWCPPHDPVSLLVYAAQSNDVHSVWINGRRVLDKRVLTTIDEEKVKQEVSRRGLKLVGK